MGGGNAMNGSLGFAGQMQPIPASQPTSTMTLNIRSAAPSPSSGSHTPSGSFVSNSGGMFNNNQSGNPDPRAIAIRNTAMNQSNVMNASRTLSGGLGGVTPSASLTKVPINIPARLNVGQPSAAQPRFAVSPQQQQQQPSQAQYQQPAANNNNFSMPRLQQHQVNAAASRAAPSAPISSQLQRTPLSSPRHSASSQRVQQAEEFQEENATNDAGSCSRCEELGHELSATREEFALMKDLLAGLQDQLSKAMGGATEFKQTSELQEHVLTVGQAMVQLEDNIGMLQKHMSELNKRVLETEQRWKLELGEVLKTRENFDSTANSIQAEVDQLRSFVGSVSLEERFDGLEGQILDVKERTMWFWADVVRDVRAYSQPPVDLFGVDRNPEHVVSIVTAGTSVLLVPPLLPIDETGQWIRMRSIDADGSQKDAWIPLVGVPQVLPNASDVTESAVVCCTNFRLANPNNFQPGYSNNYDDAGRYDDEAVPAAMEYPQDEEDREQPADYRQSVSRQENDPGVIAITLNRGRQ